MVSGCTGESGSHREGKSGVQGLRSQVGAFLGLLQQKLGKKKNDKKQTNIGVKVLLGGVKVEE